MMTLISDRDAQKEPERVPIYEKVTLTIREAAEYSNIGINRLETMLKMPFCVVCGQEKAGEEKGV